MHSVTKLKPPFWIGWSPRYVIAATIRHLWIYIERFVSAVCFPSVVHGLKAKVFACCTIQLAQLALLE